MAEPSHPGPGDGRQPGRSIVRRLTAVVAVVGALAIVAALVGTPMESGQAPAFAVPGHLAVLGLDTVIGAGIAFGVLIVIGSIWGLVAAGRPDAPRRRPWWHTAFGLLVFVAVMGAITAWAELGVLEEPLARLNALITLPTDGEADAFADPAGGEQVDPALRQVATVGGAVLVGLLAALWLWWSRPRPFDDESSDGTGVLAAAVDAALSDLDVQTDPRTAILRCYAQLDSALSAAGHGRRTSETPREHRRRTAGMLGPGAQAAAVVVERFERARYAETPITEEDRRQAVAALRDVRAALDVDRDDTDHRTYERPGVRAPGGGRP